MNTKTRILTLSTIALAGLLAACASSPPPAAKVATAAPVASAPATSVAAAPNAEAPKKAPVGQPQHKWSMATEAEVAAELDKKFEEAAKQFVTLKKDDQIMYCKRYRVIGSMIPTLHCITEAELRKQVEDSDALRDRMRQTMGKCDITSGCSAGF
jgi:starvation-inducible outer membrane lipoprotein